MGFSQQELQLIAGCMEAVLSSCACGEEHPELHDILAKIYSELLRLEIARGAPPQWKQEKG